ncbi:MAG: hypothetical protein AAGF83_11935 [Cyanobacteria bacterium P01_G01_bin.67]
MRAKTFGLGLQSIFILTVGIVSLYLTISCIFCLIVPDLHLSLVPNLADKQIFQGALLTPLIFFCCGYFVWNDNTITTIKFQKIILPAILIIQLIYELVYLYLDRLNLNSIQEIWRNHQSLVFIASALLAMPPSLNKDKREKDDIN